MLNVVTKTQTLSEQFFFKEILKFLTKKSYNGGRGRKVGEILVLWCYWHKTGLVIYFCSKEKFAPM